MIFNKTEYNPLPVIFKVLSDSMTMTEHSTVMSELYKAGVVAETDSEYDSVIKDLKELKKVYDGK